MPNTGYPFTKPASAFLADDLLFFDTFSHTGEKDNFDLVQFPSPVVIDLIKIVPLGQPVKAEIPGNVRLGATNPTKCEIQFFINDLTKQDAHTMADLGTFYCSEKETDFIPPLQIQTDGLLLRGNYRTLTLAIFGQLAIFEEKIEDGQIVFRAISPPAQTPASPVASERDLPYIVRSVNQELLNIPRDDAESFDGSTVKSVEPKDKSPLNNEQEMIEEKPIVEDESPIEQLSKDQSIFEEMSSNDEVLPAYSSPKDKKFDELEHHITKGREKEREGDKIKDRERESDNYSRPPHKEEVSSKSKTRVPETNHEDDAQSLKDTHMPQDALEWSFVIDTYCPKPLIYFADPSMTLQERSLVAKKTKSGLSNYKEPIEKEIEKVKEVFDILNCSDELKSDEWVTLIEDLTNDIANMSLSQTVSDKEMLKFLVKQVCHGLDINLALQQKQTGFKVRYLRTGVKLASILFHCGETAISTLLEASVPYRVLQLYHENQMSLPLRLLIFRCLNAACDTVEGVEHIISYKYNWACSRQLFQNARLRLKEMDQAKKGLLEQHTEASPTKFDSSVPTESNLYTNENDESGTLGKQPNLAQKLSPKKFEDESELEEMPLTCYQVMVLILLSRPTTRVTIAIGNLIKKIRLFRNLSKLVAINTQEYEDSDDSLLDSNKVMQHEGNHLEQSIPLIQDIVNLIKDNASSISQPIRYLPAELQFQIKPNSFDTYLAVYKWLKHFKILDHLNNLLNATQIENFDSMPSVKIEQLIRLQCLCLLLIQQILDSPKGMQFFLNEDCCGMTHNLLRSLAEKRPPKWSSHLRMSDGIENYMNTSLCRDESLSASSCHDMSLRMSYSLKVFSCIDKLFHFHRELINKRGESTAIEPEKVLHQLYIMSAHPYGLEAIVKHFSCVGNLDCLLRFFDMPDYHKQLEFVKETSIDYVLELVGTFFRLNNNVLEMADEYLDTLVDLCKTKDKTLSVRIKSLLPWLSPFDADQPFPLITYSEETFRQLTRIIRKSIPNYTIPFAKGLDFELPPQMITAVRIMRQLCIPPQVEAFIKTNFDVFSSQKLNSNNEKSAHFMAFVDSLPHQQNQNQSWNLNMQISRNIGSSCLGEDSISEQLSQISNTFKLFQPYDESICGELKYHYGLMLVFEQEGLKRLLNTLRELVGNYPTPIYQSAALSGFRGRIVISYIHSVIILLHSLVCHLIDARGGEFKDASVIPVILETYSLLCFVPKPDNKKSKDSVKENDLSSLQKSISIRSANFHLAQQTKKLILSILMSYTQLCLSVSESEEKVISKSMWTRMLKEVIDFTLSAPVFFHHGLDILTKILPSPLPCSSMMDSIDQEQLFKNINHRKLWSAHLHPLHQQLEQMISSLSICYQSNIRTLLWYLCNQLCDLSSNAACMVTKILTDSLISFASKLSLDNATGGSNLTPDNGQNQCPQPHEDRLLSQPGAKESVYGVKMILNILTNLITNQAFETAFANHLQIISKKDEKLMASLQNALKLNDDQHRSSELTEESLNSNSNNCLNFIESLKAMNNNSSKDGYPVIDVAPPEELVKIDLLDLVRKTSDRFSLASSLKRTYRLKVLLDLNSNSHRSSESSSKRFDHAPYNYQELSVPASHKPYMAPLRGRGRPGPTRADSFRSRLQNTSRPPSIHVDDFNDIYGQDSSLQSSSSRYAGNGTKMPPDYRASNSGRGFPEMPPSSHNDAHRSNYFTPQPPSLPSGAPYSSGSSRSHSKSKYMKMK